MWDLDNFVAKERYRDYQREAERAHVMHNAVRAGINGNGSRHGWRNHRQRLGHSLVRAGTAIAGDPDPAVR